MLSLKSFPSGFSLFLFRILVLNASSEMVSAEAGCEPGEKGFYFPLTLTCTGCDLKCKAVCLFNNPYTKLCKGSPGWSTNACLCCCGTASPVPVPSLPPPPPVLSPPPPPPIPVPSPPPPSPPPPSPPTPLPPPPPPNETCNNVGDIYRVRTGGCSFCEEVCTSFCGENMQGISVGCTENEEPFANAACDCCCQESTA